MSKLPNPIEAGLGSHHSPSNQHNRVEYPSIDALIP